jgi:hypothetical protein
MGGFRWIGPFVFGLDCISDNSHLWHLQTDW